jgi:flagellar basal-body rod protein FlgG
MISALWIAKTGMQAQQTQLDVISNNLANVSTNGYKRSSAVFEDLMYQNLRQTGAETGDQTQLPTGLQVGLGVRAVGTQRSFAQGNLQQTGNPYDLAINGQGFFQMEMPDGTVAYSRDGSFVPNAQGRLVNSAGVPLSDNITVPPGTKSVTVGNDGRVVATLSNNTTQAIGTLSLVQFTNPAGLEPKGQNLYVETPSSGQPNVGTPGAEGFGTLMQGYVETSNVNVVQELVSMIQTQRAFEMNSKAIQTSDQMLQRLGQL